MVKKQRELVICLCGTQTGTGKNSLFPARGMRGQGFPFHTDGIIIVGHNSSRIRYEQALYLRGHDSLWLDGMVDRRQIWIHDRLRG